MNESSQDNPALKKRVLDVGQCDPDHGAIRRMLDREFDVEITRVNTGDEAVAQLRARPFDLVLINRKLDIDYSDGLEILKRIKADRDLKEARVMLVTNYPEHQETAVAAGALYGFGKAQLNDGATVERLTAVLG